MVPTVYLIFSLKLLPLMWKKILPSLKRRLRPEERVRRPLRPHRLLDQQGQHPPGHHRLPAQEDRPGGGPHQDLEQGEEFYIVDGKEEGDGRPCPLFFAQFLISFAGYDVYGDGTKIVGDKGNLKFTKVRICRPKSLRVAMAHHHHHYCH